MLLGAFNDWTVFVVGCPKHLMMVGQCQGTDIRQSKCDIMMTRVLVVEIERVPMLSCRHILCILRFRECHYFLSLASVYVEFGITTQSIQC